MTRYLVISLVKNNSKGVKRKQKESMNIRFNIVFFVILLLYRHNDASQLKVIEMEDGSGSGEEMTTTVTSSTTTVAAKTTIITTQPQTTTSTDYPESRFISTS